MCNNPKSSKTLKDLAVCMELSNEPSTLVPTLSEWCEAFIRSHAEVCLSVDEGPQTLVVATSGS